MSTCDHICRECGQVMNCQHCKPYSLPVDRARIAELEKTLSEIHASVRRVTFTAEWYLDGLRHEPGDYVIMRVGPVPDGYEPAF